MLSVENRKLKVVALLVLLAWRLPWLRSSLLLHTTSQEVLLFSEKERVVAGSMFF
jgi:hypothetical protein